ncbi:diguanylate cyclase (GGDEF) domain-containing protein [Natronincola peptidivorans]|uniref:Diguanylate cyclase (GGDEF) domain-containing protein n=1 Tax=Natronincola peptidivorans TaxID=426128 RepID=A0A1I0GGQ1_9FIRM|nr:diguanylate cyclase [Natronincola peptidivorans]SET69487.1 diguanylate cyclase (GGDEF) domain-containing protein [Natronincola peptidivorans]
MKLINNRYKIETCVDKNEAEYVATDLFKKDRKMLIYIVENNSFTKEFLKYCIDNFYKVSSLNHSNILSVYSFGIVESIDDKPNHDDLYYYTTEYIDKESTILAKNKTHQEIVLHCYKQLFSCLQYLHFHGIIYKLINLETLFFYQPQQQLKFLDLITIKKKEMEKKYIESDLAYFTAPELTYGIEVGEYTDIYSLGVFLYYMHTGKEFYHTQLLNKIKDTYSNPEKQWEYDFFSIIKIMTNLDFTERMQSVYETNEKIANLFGIQEKLENKKELEVLNFKTPITGREAELQQVFYATKLKEGRIRKTQYNLLLIHGASGIGKTRFLNEVIYRMRLEKYKSFNTSITTPKDSFFSVMPVLLRRMLKEATPTLIEKYGNDLVKLIPEIRTNKNLQHIRELPEEKELLRLYDRVANFIIALTTDKPSIITIDNIDVGDLSIIKFIDYFVNLNILKQSPVWFVVTFNEETYRYIAIEAYVDKWKKRNTTMEIKLGSLTLEETAEIIQNILGWNKRPLGFASEVVKETEGNPYVVEEMLKAMLGENLLKVDWDSKNRRHIWRKTFDHYSKPRFSNIFDKALLKQIESANELQKRVLETISIFKTAVSLETINRMLGEKQDYSPYLEELVQLKILNEKLEDWGYTYGFYSKQLKHYIYNNINKTIKVSMHIAASRILEDLYKKEARENKDELIYHLIQANQRDKAIGYCIESGDGMYRLKVYTQAMYFYDRAYKLFEPSYDERKIQIIIKLANAYQKQGNNEKAIHYYKEAIMLAGKYNDIYTMIDATNKMGHIYLLRNETDIAIDYLEKNTVMATKHKNHDGLLEAGYLLSNGYINTGKLTKAEVICEDHLKLANQYQSNGYIGLFLSQKGLIRHLKNNPVHAIKLFKDSVTYFEKANRKQDAGKTLNNIGNVFLDYFQDSKNAKKYFERALAIAQQFDDFEVMVRSYQGIATAYMLEDEYKKAVDLLRKNIELSFGLQDESIRFLGYLSTIDCYRSMGEYRKAYSYLQKIEKEQPIYLKQGIYRERYYEIAVKFYKAVGSYEEALDYIHQYHRQNKLLDQTDLKQKLKMQKLEFFINLQLKKPVKDKALFNIIEKYRKTSYSRDRRELLFDACMHFLNKKDWAVLQHLLEEDDSIASLLNTDYFKLQRKYIQGLSAETIEEKTRILENLLSHKAEELCKELKWKIYKELGEGYFVLKEFYKATSHYFQALYTIKTLYFKVPEEYKNNYLLSKEKYHIKEKLLDMEKLINTGGFYFYNSINDSYLSPKTAIDPKNFFEISSMQSLFKNPEFYNLALEQYEKVFPFNIHKVEDLVKALVYNTEYNLDLLLKLAAKNLLATKAIIATHNNYEKVVSLGQEIMIEEIGHILEKVAKKQQGLYINNINNFMETDKEFMYHDTKAFICLPIIENPPEHEITQQDKRQFVASKLLGYLYLETDEIFNNFTVEGYEECEKLLALAAILLDNYYLKISSFTDKLTGVFTRKHFEYVLEEEVEKVKNQNLCFSIIMCDIDYFKKINDNYGHQKGDELLAKVGGILRKSIRKTDFVGRYGGEEFIILLPQTTKKQAFKVAEKIRDQLQESALLGQEELTISCGVATYYEDATNKEAIIEKADQALYTAKERGRNQTVLWEEGISFHNKRADKLAGIITGNIVEDQQNVLVMTETIELMEKGVSTEEKIFFALGRLVELLHVNEAVLLRLNNEEIVEKFARRRFQETWVEDMTYNHSLIQRVIETRKGEFLIDWHDTSEIDIITGTPNWKSVMTVPIIYAGDLKGIMLFSVPVKEKELDFYAYNIARTTAGIIGAFLSND